jgi:hypothetical protein
MKEMIKRWYDGEYIPPKNDANSTLYFVCGDYKRHWTAKLARWAVEFYMKEWKWALGAAAAVISFVFLKRI